MSSDIHSDPAGDNLRPVSVQKVSAVLEEAGITTYGVPRKRKDDMVEVHVLGDISVVNQVLERAGISFIRPNLGTTYLCTGIKES